MHYSCRKSCPGRSMTRRLRRCSPTGKVVTCPAVSLRFILNRISAEFYMRKARNGVAALEGNLVHEGLQPLYGDVMLALEQTSKVLLSSSLNRSCLLMSFSTGDQLEWRGDELPASHRAWARHAGLSPERLRLGLVGGCTMFPRSEFSSWNMIQSKFQV